MASDSDDRVPHAEESNPRRGLTIMKKVILARSKGEKIMVEWNQSGQPIEPNSSILVSYIGAIVRQMVPITKDNWRDPGMDTYKAMIWTDVQTSFIIDDNHRKFVLKEAGRLHRIFRTRLTKHFLKDANGNINDHPPELYAHIISEDDWRGFIAKRLDNSFQELSNVNRQRASKPQYPYRRSRIGYARLEQKLIQDTGTEVTTVPRHILWKAARVNKDGVIDNKNVQQVWEQCENLSQSLPQEEVIDCGPTDILSQALKLPEYPGRVRGKGFGVTKRDYFQPQKRAKQEDIDHLKGLYLMMMKRLTEVESMVHGKEASERQQPDLGMPSAKDSCTLASDSLPKGVSPCQLYLSSPTYRVVGTGKVYNFQSDNLHGRPLPTGHVRVGIEVAIEPCASLPVPIDDELTVITHAIGTFVAWPINLVALDVVIPTKSKHTEQTKESVAPSISNRGKSVLQDPSPASATTSLPRYCSYVDIHVQMRMEADDTLMVSMEKDIFGYLYDEPISRDQINELLHHQWLGVSVVCVYIRYLYDKLMRPQQLINRFFFLSPHRTNVYEKQGREKAIVDLLLANNVKGKLVLAPYNTGGHWVLLAINPTAEVIYYLDPMYHEPNTYSEMKELFNKVLIICRPHLGTMVSKSKSNNITWTRIKCPTQTNNIDCGYYVLRFMKEIITSNQMTIPKEYFPDYRCPHYVRDQLTEVKEDWCRYLVEMRIV